MCVFVLCLREVGGEGGGGGGFTPRPRIIERREERECMCVCMYVRSSVGGREDGGCVCDTTSLPPPLVSETLPWWRREHV